MEFNETRPTGLVLDELKQLRKRSAGADLAGVSQCSVICQLLGHRDPAVAHGALQSLPFTLEYSTEIEAACYALGLASTADTVLGRLEEFAGAHFIDQRQARRLSDRGLEQLAALITTNWTRKAVPTVNVLVTPAAPHRVAVFVKADRPDVVEMKDFHITLANSTGEDELPATLESEEVGDRVCLTSTSPLAVPIDGDTSVSIVWRGEMWPKFAVQCSGFDASWTTVVESLGAKVRIRVIELVKMSV